jgi:hypothetical protein
VGFGVEGLGLARWVLCTDKQCVVCVVCVVFVVCGGRLRLSKSCGPMI